MPRYECDIFLGSGISKGKVKKLFHGIFYNAEVKCSKDLLRDCRYKGRIRNHGHLESCRNKVILSDFLRAYDKYTNVERQKMNNHCLECDEQKRVCERHINNYLVKINIYQNDFYGTRYVGSYKTPQLWCY